ncbi:MAG: methyl-accepting chemotaxis protein [Desulfobulbus sp.]|nr:methyl-accepting chemotaxis protein [Desulfobulbus sp.]
MNISSIRFKLIVGGILIVLLPLAVSGYVAKNNSAKAVTHYSKANAQSIADGLAMQVTATLEGELKFVTAFAGRTQVKLVAGAVAEKGIDGAGEAIEVISRDMQKRFEQLRTSYDAIILTDAQGKIYASASENAEEVRSIDLGRNGLFEQARSSGKAVSGEVVRSASDNQPEILLCAPVYSNSGSFQGVFAGTLKFSLLSDLITGKKIGTTGYCFMSNEKGLIIAHPDAKNVLQLDLKSLKGMEDITTAMVAGKIGAASYVYKGIDKVAGYAPIKLKGWSIAATQNAKEFLASVVSLQKTIALITLASILIAGVLIFVAASAIIRPINKAIEGLKDIAQGEGDLTMRLAVTSKDEVGELAKWFNLFIDKLQQIIGRISENSRQVHLSISELGGISAAMAQNAEDTSGRANNVATAAEEMSANLNTVAAAMEESTINTNMVASAAEEMSVTINQIAHNAEQAHSISEKAVHQAANTTEKMAELGQAAQAIGKVTEAITEISEQTNLLALNATIEAARAGEAGKGFAVVANEIKELAKQTAAATLDIKNQIAGVQGTTKSTVEEIKQISKIIDSVNEIVATISTAVGEQSAATEEIANNIAQASQGLGEVNENVNQSSAVAGSITRDIAGVNMASNEISASSRQVKSSAETLKSLADELQGIVKTFKI